MTDVETKRALIEQAHQLHELTLHPGWPILVDFMLVKMAADKKRILSGDIVHMDQYREMTGYFNGVHATLNAHETVETLAANARRRETERDEDDAA